ncbi:uncharacterized protein LOC131470586 [Solea solea]|uniref:uncharacterized protein LOC131470586 n=1 Tax=Solea solea TaxID=90069 RepID=UPI00272C1115|nr:uncharacterized protein LOC131470586 [Solea solea]XP_058502483.1 uncharacterized protein LOC131470586 [Solea solea]XP_058502484.1 uncharacterized protein LOC131470586 [Solea solea]
MANKIAETTQSLSTAAEMRETTKLLMQPKANWEEYLTPAPLSIAILGELVFISSNDDFSINKNPPAGGFKHIKYPDSFRACLMQICNSGWEAFNDAHNGMDRIRLHTSTIPNYIKTSVDILFNASDKVIETLLPDQLENIRSIADDCVEQATMVEKRYSDVISLIGELLEACVNAEHFYGEELKEVKKKIKENKMREQTARMQNDQTKKAMQAMAKQMEEAQDAYKQSMDSLPSGWEVIGMNFVDGIQSSVVGMMNGMVNLVGGNVNTSNASSEDHTHESGDACADENCDAISQINASCTSGEILNLATGFDEYVRESDIDWKKLYDEKSKSTKTAWDKEQFTRILKQLDQIPKGPQCKDALSLCETGIEICEDLATYNPGKKWDIKSTVKLLGSIKKLKDAAHKFDSKAKKTLGTPALAAKGPMKYKSEKTSSANQRKLAGEVAIENARFQIEQTRAELKDTRESYGKAVENMEKKEQELNAVLIELQSCEIKEISFDQTIKMLVKGLDAMGRVQEQWKKMVRFFQMISNIIQISLNKTLKNFVKTSDSAMKLDYNEKLYTKDLLYMQAFQASNVASLVHMISSTYTEVSNEYLMDRVSSLGKLMAMDKEKPEFLIERQKLQSSCTAAQKGILRLVLKNKREFENKTNARMAKIENGLKAVLPEASAEETQRIKENVQDGYGEEINNYY